MKRFSKKYIEKEFLKLYPSGSICLEKGFEFFTFNMEQKPINIRNIDLYEVALVTGIASQKEVNEMKKAAGYVFYQ